MRLNKEILFKENIILFVLVFIDQLLVVGAYGSFTSAYALKILLHENVGTWLQSLIVFNLLVAIPLSLWVKEVK